MQTNTADLNQSTPQFSIHVGYLRHVPARRLGCIQREDWYPRFTGSHEPVQFESPAVDGASQRLVTAAGSQHSFTGVTTKNSLQPATALEPGTGSISVRNGLNSDTLAIPNNGADDLVSWGCSLPRNGQSSKRCSPGCAPSNPPRPPAFAWGTSCSSARARITTGRRRSSWCARFATMARSAARSCGLTGLGAGKRGTPTGRQKSPGSGVLPSPSLRSRCAPGDAWSLVLSATNGEGRRRGSLHNGEKWNFYSLSEPKPHSPKTCLLPRFFSPDNEHHVASARSP